MTPHSQVEALTAETTNALVLAARDGNTWAKDRLILSLLPLGAWLAGKYPTIPADEVVSICGLAAVEVVAQLLDPGKLAITCKLSTYAVAVMRNRLNQEVFSQSTMVSRPDSVPDETLDTIRHIEDPSLSPERQTAQHEQCEHVEALLSRRQSSVIHALYIDRLTVNQAAVQLELSEKQVVRARHYALRILRQHPELRDQLK